jgi:hypothetical protein
VGRASGAGYADWMRDAFSGFVVLRLIALLALLTVAALVFGIKALTRGSDATGIALLAAAVALAGAAAALISRRPGRPRR